MLSRSAGPGSLRTIASNPSHVPIRHLRVGSSLVQTNCDLTPGVAAALLGGHSLTPKGDDDMDSLQRAAVASDFIREESMGGHGHSLSPAAAALLSTRSLSGAKGVRVGMTLYMCVMRPHAGQAAMTVAVPTRTMGPRIALPVTGGTNPRKT